MTKQRVSTQSRHARHVNHCAHSFTFTMFLHTIINTTLLGQGWENASPIKSANTLDSEGVQRMTMSPAH